MMMIGRRRRRLARILNICIFNICNIEFGICNICNIQYLQEAGMMIGIRRRRLARNLPLVTVNKISHQELFRQMFCHIKLCFVTSLFCHVSQIYGTKLEKHCFNRELVLNPVFTDRGKSAVGCALIVLDQVNLNFSGFVYLFSPKIYQTPPPPPKKNQNKCNDQF